MRTLCLSLFGVVLLSSQLASAQWDPESRRRLEEEARLNEMRAREMQPIIDRNRQAQSDMIADVGILEGQARAMHDRARWYRDAAARPGVWHREHLERTANELDQYAGRNEQLARNERGISDSIGNMVRDLEATRNWHAEVARRMRESLGWR